MNPDAWIQMNRQNIILNKPLYYYSYLRLFLQSGIFLSGVLTKIIEFFVNNITCHPVPVAAQSKAQVCGRSPAEIVGSNPTAAMDICLLWVLCVIG